MTADLIAGIYSLPADQINQACEEARNVSHLVTVGFLLKGNLFMIGPMFVYKTYFFMKFIYKP